MTTVVNGLKKLLIVQICSEETGSHDGTSFMIEWFNITTKMFL